MSDTAMSGMAPINIILIIINIYLFIILAPVNLALKMRHKAIIYVKFIP